MDIVACRIIEGDFCILGKGSGKTSEEGFRDDSNTFKLVFVPGFIPDLDFDLGDEGCDALDFTLRSEGREGIVRTGTVGTLFSLLREPLHLFIGAGLKHRAL